MEEIILKIMIDSEMREKAYKFATEIEKTKNQFARLNQDESVLIETTYIGKLGEEVVLNYFKMVNQKIETNQMFEIFEGQTNVDDFDFRMSDGNTVDVKNGYLEKHKRLMVNASQLFKISKDIYIGVKVFTNGDPIRNAGELNWQQCTFGRIQGWISKEELKTFKSENWGKAQSVAVPYNQLHDIAELIKND